MTTSASGTPVRGRAGLASVMAHLIFIVIICILPEMLMRYAAGDRLGDQSTPWWFYAKSGIMIAVFYINYFFLIERTLVRRRSPWKFVVLNLLLITAMAVLMWYLNSLGWQSFHRAPKPDAPIDRVFVRILSFILRDAIMLVLSVSLALALRLSDRWLDLERRRDQLLAERRENELRSLRDQLNPHFLFNTLNSIYALIEIAPAEARKAVLDLSRLLRYLVYENPASVDIQNEVNFINNYVELMRLRLGDRPVEVNIDINTTKSPLVPPLLFVTLVENAFKHGITPSISDSVVISIRATDDSLECKTVNHVDPTAGRDADSGVGLANLRRRLELIYGHRASLHIDIHDNIFTAIIKITDPWLPLDV
ncbi:MAG: histidine kinase [Muribaculaceae bacterium]|nr:histidine kinase [Muribaculaceae bacterium]